MTTTPAKKGRADAGTASCSGAVDALACHGEMACPTERTEIFTMKFLELKKQHTHALNKAESIIQAAETAGRELTAAETLDVNMAMSAAKALEPKISAIQSMNTMSQFFNRDGALLMDGGLASPASNRNQKPMSEEYTNAFVAFLRSGGKQASDALSEGFDPLFGGFALPSLPGVSAALYEGTAAVPTARAAMPSPFPRTGTSSRWPYRTLVSVPWRAQFPRPTTSNFQVNPRSGQPESRPKAERQPTRSQRAIQRCHS